MEAADLSRADWRKSRYSGGNGNCVEVAGCPSDANRAAAGDTDRVVLVRDTAAREGATLAFTAGAWARFLASVE